MFSSQKEERSVLLGVGSLEFVTEPEPPLLLELQPAHRLPQGATICTDDTQSRTYREADRREKDRDFNYDMEIKITLGCHHHHKQISSWFTDCVFAKDFKN